MFPVIGSLSSNMPTSIPNPKSKLHRQKIGSPPANEIPSPVDADPNKVVPISSDGPLWLRNHIDKAAGIGTRAAMVRDILVKWSEANKSSR